MKIKVLDDKKTLSKTVEANLKHICHVSNWLKAQGHVTVNKLVISIIYIVAHTWPLCSAQILVDGVNLQ